MSTIHSITGTISEITTKTITIKNGPRAGSDATVFYVVMDGKPINVGFSCPYEEGERVTINVAQQYGEWRVSKGAPTATGWPKETATPAPSGGASKSSGFPIDKEDRQMSIVRQNSMAHAVNIVHNYLETGTSGADDLAIKTRTLEDYIELVIQTAYKVTEFSTGHLEINEVKKMLEGKD